MKEKEFIKDNWKLWLFVVLFILVLSMGWASGYITKMVQDTKNQGVAFHCWDSIYDKRGRTCHANITMPNNVSIRLESDFNLISVLTEE